MVRSVDRALRVLFCIAASPNPIGLAEISASTEVDKATVLRFLQTLETFRLVCRDESRRYSVGSGVWQLSRTFRRDLRLLAEPFLAALRDETGESVSLVVERGLERVVLHVVEASVELRVVPTLNRVVPIYSGASGKVIMAFKSEAERSRIIEATGLGHANKSGQIDPVTYLEQLEQVRKDGYATAIGDVSLGAAAIAAPIFDHDGALQAVVSLRGPEARMSPSRVLVLAPLVVRAADAISHELSGIRVPSTDD